MVTATLTSKGQITVPKPIRKKLGLRPGDRLSFREKSDGTVVVEAAAVDLMTLAGSLKSRVKGATVEQMDRAIRRQAARNHR